MTTQSKKRKNGRKNVPSQNSVTVSDESNHNEQVLTVDTPTDTTIPLPESLPFLEEKTETMILQPLLASMDENVILKEKPTRSCSSKKPLSEFPPTVDEDDETLSMDVSTHFDTAVPLNHLQTQSTASHQHQLQVPSSGYPWNSNDQNDVISTTSNDSNASFPFRSPRNSSSKQRRNFFSPVQFDRFDSIDSFQSQNSSMLDASMDSNTDPVGPNEVIQLSTLSPVETAALVTSDLICPEITEETFSNPLQPILASIGSVLLLICSYVFYPIIEIAKCFKMTAHLLRLAVRLGYIMSQTSNWIIMAIRLCVFVSFITPNWIRLMYEYFCLPSQQRAVAYGPNPRNTLDIYIPTEVRNNLQPIQSQTTDDNTTSKPTVSTNDQVPVVIFIPGGAWTIGFRLWAVLLGVHLTKPQKIYTGANESGTIIKKRSSRRKVTPTSSSATSVSLSSFSTPSKPLQERVRLAASSLYKTITAPLTRAYDQVKKPFDEVNSLAAMIDASATDCTVNTLNTTSNGSENGAITPESGESKPASTKRTAKDIMEQCTKNGSIMVSVDYRNFPQGNIYDMITDVVTAFEWVIDHIAEYGGNPNNITICGQSAGAHILLLALLKSWEAVQDAAMSEGMTTPFLSPAASAAAMSSSTSTATSGSSSVMSDSGAHFSLPHKRISDITGPNDHESTPQKSKSKKQHKPSVLPALSDSDSSIIENLPTRWVSVVKAIVGLSGPYNLLQATETFSERGLDPAVLESIMAFPEDVRSLSPVHIAHRILSKRRLDNHPSAHISRFPRTYLWQGTADKTVNPLGALQLANILQNAGVKVTLDLWKRCSHTDLIIELPAIGYDPLAAQLQWVIAENIRNELNQQQRMRERAQAREQLKLVVSDTTSSKTLQNQTAGTSCLCLELQTRSNKSSQELIDSASSPLDTVKASDFSTPLSLSSSTSELYGPISNTPSNTKCVSSDHTDSCQRTLTPVDMVVVEEHRNSPAPQPVVDESSFILPPNPNSFLGRQRSISDVGVGDKISKLSFVMNNLDEIFQMKKEPKLIKDLHRLNDSFINHIDMFDIMDSCPVGMKLVPEPVLMFARKLNPF